MLVEKKSWLRLSERQSGAGPLAGEQNYYRLSGSKILKRGILSLISSDDPALTFANKATIPH
jgi:hypothetical protein